MAFPVTPATRVTPESPKISLLTLGVPASRNALAGPLQSLESWSLLMARTRLKNKQKEMAPPPFSFVSPYGSSWVRFLTEADNDSTDTRQKSERAEGRIARSRYSVQGSQGRARQGEGGHFVWPRLSCFQSTCDVKWPLRPVENKRLGSVPLPMALLSCAVRVPLLGETWWTTRRLKSMSAFYAYQEPVKIDWA